MQGWQIMMNQRDFDDKVSGLRAAKEDSAAIDPKRSTRAFIAATERHFGGEPSFVYGEWEPSGKKCPDRPGGSFLVAERSVTTTDGILVQTECRCLACGTTWIDWEEE
jgi:hypothetical protein